MVDWKTGAPRDNDFVSLYPRQGRDFREAVANVFAGVDTPITLTADELNAIAGGAFDALAADVQLAKEEAYAEFAAYRLAANAAFRRFELLEAQTAAVWQSVAWSPELGMFVAVGSDGDSRVAISYDGLSWENVTSAPSLTYTCVLWVSELGKFFAITTGSQVLASSDGLIWTLHDMGVTGNWQHMAWSPELGMFAAVRGSGSATVAISYDGISWQLKATPEDRTFLNIAWGAEAGYFVALASTGVGTQAIRSNDGINWTSHSVPRAAIWRSVAWAPSIGKYVAVTGSTTTTSQVMTSSDGASWSLHTTTVICSWREVIYIPRLQILVAVGSSGDSRAMTSYDGVNWVPRTLPSGAWYCLAWADELRRMVALEGSVIAPNVLVSPDIK